MGRRVRMLTGLWMLLELAVFVAVAYWIGLGWTILATLATSGIGLLLLGKQGTRALRELVDRTRDGQPPGRALGDAGLVGVGGLLMVLPGFVGDVVGLLCLLPWTRPLPRALLARVLSDRLPVAMRGPVKVRSSRAARVGPPPSGPPVVIEGDVAPAPAAGGPTEPVVEGEIVEPGDRPRQAGTTEFVAVRVVEARIVNGDHVPGDSSAPGAGGPEAGGRGDGERPRHVESHRVD